MITNEFNETLFELGVTSKTISNKEKEFIIKNGYLFCENILNSSVINKLRKKFENILEIEGPAAGVQFHTGASTLNKYGLEEGARRISNLVNKGKIFKLIYLNPKLLALAKTIINSDFVLSSLNGRDVLKNHGDQKIHSDWRKKFDGKFHVFNSIWFLDDISRDNGATKIIPKTHKLDPPNNHLLENNMLKDEIIIEGKAGSVLFINSHLWHAGTKNISGKKRRVIHAYFTAKDSPQQTNQLDNLLYKTWKNLNIYEKIILGVNE